MGILIENKNSLLKSSVCNLKLCKVSSFLPPESTLLGNIIAFSLLMNKTLSDDSISVIQKLEFHFVYCQGGRKFQLV